MLQTCVWMECSRKYVVLCQREAIVDLVDPLQAVVVQRCPGAAALEDCASEDVPHASSPLHRSEGLLAGEFFTKSVAVASDSLFSLESFPQCAC